MKDKEAREGVLEVAYLEQGDLGSFRSLSWGSGLTGSAGNRRAGVTQDGLCIGRYSGE